MSPFPLSIYVCHVESETILSTISRTSLKERTLQNLPWVGQQRTVAAAPVVVSRDTHSSLVVCTCDFLLGLEGGVLNFRDSRAH